MFQRVLDSILGAWPRPRGAIFTLSPISTRTPPLSAHSLARSGANPQFVAVPPVWRHNPLCLNSRRIQGGKWSVTAFRRIDGCDETKRNAPGEPWGDKASKRERRDEKGRPPRTGAGPSLGTQREGSTLTGGPRCDLASLCRDSLDPALNGDDSGRSSAAPRAGLRLAPLDRESACAASPCRSSRFPAWAGAPLRPRFAPAA